MANTDNARYELKTWVSPDGVIESQLLFHNNVEQHCKTMARWVVDTRDGHIRDGLIHLGWTPPADEAGEPHKP